jgi:hypothetical protein
VTCFGYQTVKLPEGKCCTVITRLKLIMFFVIAVQSSNVKKTPLKESKRYDKNETNFSRIAHRHDSLFKIIICVWLTVSCVLIYFKTI